MNNVYIVIDSMVVLNHVLLLIGWQIGDMDIIGLNLIGFSLVFSRLNKRIDKLQNANECSIIEDITEEEIYYYFGN